MRFINDDEIRLKADFVEATHQRLNGSDLNFGGMVRRIARHDNAVTRAVVVQFAAGLLNELVTVCENENALVL